MENPNLELLINHRRALHRIPEIDRELTLTNEYVTNVLSQFDCTLTTVAETGVCAYFDRGRETTTAYRSDMDALRIQEVSDCEYASGFPGKMHACGHDGHMSILLTFAKVVDEQKELPHNVLLIFQPAEETTGGAHEICETGILEKYNVTKLFGLHLWPDLPKGLLSSKPGPMMAQSNEISFTIYGKSAHAATAHKGIDVLEIGCRYLIDLYDMQRDEIPAGERTVLKIGRFESGTVRNALSDKTSCLGTMRGFNQEIINFMTSRMREIAAQYEKDCGCTFDFKYREGFPPVKNEPVLYENILPTLETLDYEELEDALMIAEDFSFYGQYVPSVFFFLGTGTGIALHSSNFDFDESILLNGVELYKALLKI